MKSFANGLDFRKSEAQTKRNEVADKKTYPLNSTLGIEIQRFLRSEEEIERLK